MQYPTLLGYCKEVYLPTRIGMKAASAGQLRAAARLYDVPLPDLCELQLSRVLADYSHGRSPATVNSKRRQILTLWSAAALDELCRPPNRKRIARAHEFRRMPTAWTVAEIERLVSIARSVRGEIDTIPKRLFWPSLILAVWNTGARISNLLSARTADCSLAERYLLLRVESNKTGMDQLFWLSDQTVAAIAAHFSLDRPLVWPWPWHPRQIWVQFRKIVLAAGLSSEPSMGLFHKLRRSNLSYTAANGGIELAQAQAGHASAATTRRHYIDPRIEQQKSARDVLPRLNLPTDDQMRLF